jgi:hypothetical protein
MYNHNNLLPIKVTSKNGTNPITKSIALYGNRTIATDSFRLLEVSAFGEAHEPKILHTELIKATSIPKKQLLFTEPQLEEATGQVANPHHNYPDVDKIMNEDPDIEYTTIKVNGRLLGELLVAMSKINQQEIVELKVPQNATYKAMHAYAETDITGQGKQTAHGLCMPLNKQ